MSNMVLIVIKTITLFISASVLWIKYKLLFLIAINCRCSSEPIFSCLCTNCLTWNDAKLIIGRNLVAWICCNSPNSADISRWLSPSATTRLSRSPCLSDETTYTNRSCSVHLLLYVTAQCLLILIKYQRWNRFSLVRRLFLIVSI